MERSCRGVGLLHVPAWSPPLHLWPRGEAGGVCESNVNEPDLYGHVHRVNHVLIFDRLLRRRLTSDLDVGAVSKESRGLVLFERGLELVPILTVTLLRDLLEFVAARQADP